MTSRCDVGAVVDMARGQFVRQEVLDHVARCPTCTARLASEQALSQDLRQLAATTVDDRPQATLEGRLLAALAATPAAPVPSRRGGTWWAAAAVLALAVGGGFMVRGDLDRARDRAVPPVAAADFVPWPGSEVLPAFESGQLLRVELPASVLPLLGILHAGTVNNETVTADVLVGQDGLARAVRLAP